METPGRIVVAAAVITAIGGIIAAAITAGDPEPTMARFTVDVREAKESPVGIDISVDGREIGTVFTHQEPFQTRDSTSPGRNDYELEATYYSPSGSEDQYEGQYSNGSDNQTCTEGQVATGSGTISVEDGDSFRIYFEGCESVSLNDMN